MFSIEVSFTWIGSVMRDFDVWPRWEMGWSEVDGMVVAFAKQIAGAVMGKTLDDSIEGTLSV